jgi:hypothetical protein
MGPCCSRLAACFSSLCIWLSSVFSKPFSGFATFAVLVNLGPLAYSAAYTAAQWPNLSLSGDCTNVPLWVVVQWALFILNAAMALYFFSVFSRPYDQNNAKDLNFGMRLNDTACNNPVVALYIIVALFMLVWQFIGTSWIYANHPPCVDEKVGKS